MSDDELGQLWILHGRPALRAFQEIVKREAPSFSAASVKRWFEQEPTNQIQSIVRAPKQKDYFHIEADGLGSVQADLIDLSNLFHSNGGFRWILCVIDTMTRYAWTAALRTKTATHVSEALHPILNEIESVPPIFRPVRGLLWTSDDGNEWKGEVSKMLASAGFTKYTVNPVRDISSVKNNVGLVERFNRTVLEGLYRNMRTEGSLRWVDFLPSVTKTYNETNHAPLPKGTTPAQLWKDPIPLFERLKERIEKTKENTEDVEERIHVGMYVRHVIDTKANPFDKATRRDRWSPEIYEVVGARGYRFQLARNGSILPDEYLARELLPVPQGTRTTNAPQRHAGANKEVKAKKRVSALQRAAFGGPGHEVEAIAPDGSVQYKARLQPKDAKRIRKIKSVLDL